jgi:hypothetical protein
MSATHSGPTGQLQSEKFARTAAAAVGAVFVVVGILGFIPGITTNYGDLAFAGHQSDAKLLGLFEVSILHNVVHLLFGIAGLALARSAMNAAYYLIGGGLVYAVLWIYGLVVDKESTVNFVPLNTADNWLHLILAIGMVAIGMVALRQLRGGVGSQTPM